MRLVLASNNAKKLSELAALFGELPLQLVTQGSLGIPEAEEPHATFVENALAKARHAARACGGAAGTRTGVGRRTLLRLAGRRIHHLSRGSPRREPPSGM